MSESKRGPRKNKAASAANSASAAQPSTQAQFDPSALLSLYSLYGYGGATGGVSPFTLSGVASAMAEASNNSNVSTEASSTSKKGGKSSNSLDGTTLGVAASQAASLGMNQTSAAWWAVASQLAAQEYLMRLQAATRDPTTYAALAAQAGMPGAYAGLLSSSKSSTPSPSSASSATAESLKLPSDTEIVKYPTSSKTSQSNRGRKKTTEGQQVNAANNAAAAMASLFGQSPPPNIPAGLTIERKRPGSKSENRTSSPVVDKVEITKVPVSTSSNGVSSSSPHQRDFSPYSSNKSETPLNLSLKSNSDAKNIPSDYYASQALSGVFLAEQIRQQQLAAALESRLETSSFSAMQAAMLMNKLKAGAETSKLLAAVAAASGTPTSTSTSALRSERPKGRGRNRQPQHQQQFDAMPVGAASPDKLNKDTVASLLAKSREQLIGFGSNQETSKLYSKPELTIEPIFKSLQPDNRFDTSDNGRRTTSVIEDGKLKIKTISDSPEIRNLSDHDENDNNGMDESDDEAGSGADGSRLDLNVGKINNSNSSDEAVAGSSTNTSDGKSGSRYAIVETQELRLPLKSGWRRETTVREYSKSGIRGDVVYYAPCGKKFKQYPDIMRYLEKKGVKTLLREHFSFSTKIFIGDFLRPSGQSETNGEERYVRMTENEILDEIDKLRRENGWKPRRRSSQQPKADGKQDANTTPPAAGSNNKASQQNNMDKQMFDAHLVESLLNRQDHQKKLLESKRKKHEEIQKAKQEEKIRRMKEEQERRHRETLIKEQQAKEVQRQQQLLFQQQVERERRRQHMVLIKQLETKKRFEELSRKRDEMRHVREREFEFKLEQKRLEVEILNEMRRPLEDMSLPDQKELPELKRIPNLKLSGEAFANTLMVYEFLNNFGETLGFDMESLPSLSTLQSAMLNDPDTEEELLSVMIHLLVCAIDDPGIPNPQKHLTMLGQNLRQADITNTNVSEILKIYLIARAQAEMRTLHGLAPPEMYNKDRNPQPPEKVEEYNRLMQETQSHNLSLKVKEKTFLCLNPTDKAEMLAFICNDLLSNKAVVRQIDNNVENVTKAKKNKWEAEMKVRKLKMIQARKYAQQMYPGNHLTPGAMEDSNASHPTNNGSTFTPMESEPASEVTSCHGDNGDDSMSVMSESTNDVTNHAQASTPATPKKIGRPRKHPLPADMAAPAPEKEKPAKKVGRKSKIVEKEEEDDDHDDSESEMAVDDHATSTHEDEDEKLTSEELQKKIDKTLRQLNKRRDELTFVTNCVRVNDLGQDRYRRRYWHFAHAAGVYVEGMESTEPWKLATEGLPHYDEDGRPHVARKDNITESDILDDDEDDDADETDEDVKMEVDDDKPVLNGSQAIKTEGDVEVKTNGDDMASALKKLGSEILVTATPKKTEEMARKFMPKITPNGDKLNMFNHSSHFNMTLSPVVLNGSVTITPKDSASHLNVPSLYGHNNSNNSYGGFQTTAPDRPWFSILPLGNPIDHTPKMEAASKRMDSKVKVEGSPMSAAPVPVAFSTPTSVHDRLYSLQPVATTSGHIAQLEEKLEAVRKMNRDNKRMPIPKEHTFGWWRLFDVHEVAELEGSLNLRGVREHQLLQNLKKNLECVQEAAKKPIPEHLELDEPECLEGVKMLPHGCSAPDVPGSWLKSVALRIDTYILEQVEALEDKVQAASMQVPGWKPKYTVEIDSRKFRPACLPPLAPGAKDEFGKDATNPVEEAKERLLDLEANIERRYLKAPLSSTPDISLQTITSSITKPSSRASRNHMHDDDSHLNGGDEQDSDEKKKDLKNADEDNNDEDEDEEEEGDDKEKEVLPKGLVQWREGIRQSKTAAQVKTNNLPEVAEVVNESWPSFCCHGVLETSIAWHKSIMKAFCQLCHCGDNEDSLLLCDGCDKGYHTYCFKPTLDQIPDGDWYCFECINKATGLKHCLVCGKQTGKNLACCSTCPRAYHADCLSPALHKIPRGKWQCPGCNQKIPRKYKKKKLSTHILQPPDTEDSSTNNSVASNAEPEEELKPAKTKKSVLSQVEDEREASASPKLNESGSRSTRRSATSTPSAPPPPEKRRKLSKADRDMTVCSTIISEMEAMDDAWPFLFPVNTKQFPTYKKIIKNPMDFATIKRKLDIPSGSPGSYKSRDEFVEDVRLIFTNCELFNEDDSPVGKAGHALSNHFDARWTELTSN